MSKNVGPVLLLSVLLMSLVLHCAVQETGEMLRGKGEPRKTELSVGPVVQGYL